MVADLELEHEKIDELYESVCDEVVGGIVEKYVKGLQEGNDEVWQHNPIKIMMVGQKFARDIGEAFAQHFPEWDHEAAFDKYGTKQIEKFMEEW